MNRLHRLVATFVVVTTSASAWAQSSGLNATDVHEDELAPYYGFAMDLTMSDGSGLNSVGESYRNDLSFYFEPTWNFGKRFLRKGPLANAQLAMRFVVSAALSGVDESTFGGQTSASPQGTCSNVILNNGQVDPASVAYCHPPGANRRADYSDIWLTLRFPKVYTIPKLGVSISPALRFVLPTSAQSRFSTMILALTPSIGFARPFWGGKIRPNYSIGVTKYFHEYTSAGITPQTGTAATQGGNAFDGAVGAGISNFYQDPTRVGSAGGSNPSVTLLNIMGVGFQLHKKVSLDVLYILVDTWKYGQDCTPTAANVPAGTNVCANGNAVAGRSGSTLNRPGYSPSQTLWVSLTYQPWDYMGFTLSWINSAPRYNGDSTYRQGIISTSYDAFTTISLGTTISIDEVATAIRKRNKRGLNTNTIAKATPVLNLNLNNSKEPAAAPNKVASAK